MTIICRTFTATLVAAVGMALAGCGKSDEGVATTLLVGKVTLDNKPITTGTITAYRGSSMVMESGINPDGTYEFPNLSSGDYQFTVTKTDTPTPYGKPVKLPAKYADPTESGLNATVSNGQRNSRDMVLSAK